MSCEVRIRETEKTFLWRGRGLAPGSLFGMFMVVARRLHEAGVWLFFFGKRGALLRVSEWGCSGSGRNCAGWSSGRVDGECVKRFLLGWIIKGGETYEAGDECGLCLTLVGEVKERFAFVECSVRSSEVVARFERRAEVGNTLLLWKSHSIWNIDARSGAN